MRVELLRNRCYPRFCCVIDRKPCDYAAKCINPLVNQMGMEFVQRRRLVLQAYIRQGNQPSNTHWCIIVCLVPGTVVFSRLLHERGSFAIALFGGKRSRARRGNAPLLRLLLLLLSDC